LLSKEIFDCKATFILKKFKFKIFLNFKVFADKIKKNNLLPNMDDYFGALMGIFRLQDTYNIEPKMFLNKTLSRFYPTYKKLNCNLPFLKILNFT